MEDTLMQTAFLNETTEPAESMDIQTIDGVALLRLGGRFDAHQAPQIGAWLHAASTRTPARVVINLEGVHFLDSTALGTLVKAMKRCRQQGGDLRICGLQQPVRIIFELTRLDRALALYDSEVEAMQAAW
jgi:anti-sigma B factor antagonist